MVQSQSHVASPFRLSPEEIKSAIPSVLSLGQSYFVGQCLYTIIKLGVPDAIGSETLSVSEIAKRVKSKKASAVREEALLRCLRLLAASGGVFCESAGPDGEHCYSLTPMGALLQTNIPGQPSLASGMLIWNEAFFWNGWLKLSNYVEGENMNDKEYPFELAHGMPVFDYFAIHPEVAKPFNEFMSFFSAEEIPTILELVPWRDYIGKRILDIGGSYGLVMGAVKQAFPDIKVVSFDLPEVIDAAKSSVEAPEGVHMVSGDMFDSTTLPENVDAIFMKHILHDWDDDSSRKILQICHDALPLGGKVFIADAILPNAGEMSDFLIPQAYLDTSMLIIGGKERTKDQWTKLAQSAKFKVQSFTLSLSPLCQITTLVKE